MKNPASPKNEDGPDLPMIEQMIGWIEAWDEGGHDEDSLYNSYMSKAVADKLRAAEKLAQECQDAGVAEEDGLFLITLGNALRNYIRTGEE